MHEVKGAKYRAVNITHWKLCELRVYLYKETQDESPGSKLKQVPDRVRTAGGQRVWSGTDTNRMS